MHKVGYEMIGGEAAPSNNKGTHGGVAVFSKSQFKAGTVQHFTIEGCGFCAAEVRVKGVSLLLVSVYLNNSTPLQCHPNAEIIGRLVALVRAHVGQWLVAGDFNITPHELSATNVLSEMRGHVLTVGEATTQGGSELDFVITSYAIAGLAQVDLDWSAPHRPHASLCVQLTLPRNTVTSLRLPEFSVKDAEENAKLSMIRPPPSDITIVNQRFNDEVTQEASGQRVDSVLILYVRKLGLVFALLVVQFFLEQFAARILLSSAHLGDLEVLPSQQGLSRELAENFFGKASQGSWLRNFSLFSEQLFS